MRVPAAWFAVLLVAPLLAGCASKGDGGAPQQQASLGGTAPFADPSVSSAPVKVTPMSQRWHFHDYWKGHPTITLLNRDINFTPMQDDNGLPQLSEIVSLPQGVIVPAETGFLTINVTWAGTVPGGAVNLTYRPADGQGYFGAGNLSSGKPMLLLTTESMCDVPHRQESYWRFNFTAVPNGTPPAMPPTSVHVNISATIGRPLFIDPPHVDWWQGSDVLTLVKGAKGDVATAVTRAGNVTLGALGAPNVPPSTTSAPAAPSDVVVGVDGGHIVPEGSESIVAILNWTSQAPGQKLTLRYHEGNGPTDGALSISKDSDTSRIFVLNVQPPQTDTTYSNRTTWEFHVIPEGGTGTEAAFQGSFTLVAWVTKLPPADAIKAVMGPKEVRGSAG